MSRQHEVEDSAPAGSARIEERVPPRVLAVLRESIDTMPKAVSRIAKYTLENPEKVVHQSVTELAEFSRSGQATVVRFCRGLGFEGFRDFKLALVADMERRRLSEPPSGISADYEVIERLHQGLITAFQDVRDQMQIDILETTADRLAASRRIDIYGAGVSGIVGELFAYRLLRLGLTAQAFKDANTAHEVAGGLGSDSVAIAVSESGITPDTIQFIHAARKLGAFTVAIIGRVDTPLTAYADQVLVSAAVEPPTPGGPIISAPGKIFLIEALSALVAQRLS